MGNRVRRIAAALALIAVGLVLVQSSSTAAEPLRLLSTKRLGDRLREMRFESQALGGPTSVRILVPEGFDERDRDDEPLPVLWLLHGCCDDFKSWTEKGDTEDLTENLDLVIVMPDGGRGGFYSDWYNGGRGGPPAWETYHLVELRNWVETNLPVRTDRAGRSIAGLSMGGFGAMAYAARHPDLFGVAAAYSGAVDIMQPGIGQFADYAATMDGGQPGDIWGDRVTEETRWRAHNPVDLATNLASVDVLLRTGNGMPGGKYGGGPDVLEIGVHQTMVSLHQRLVTLGQEHVWEDYGPGAHQWPYWMDGLELTLPRVMKAAAEKDDPPETVAHIAYEPSYSVWGFTVSLNRPVLETSKLEVRRNGFALTGSGQGTVTTPSQFTPGSPVDVTIGNRTTRAEAGTDGRVAVAVDLGPPNTAAQHSPPAVALGVRQSTVEVIVTAAASGTEPTRVDAELPPDGGLLPATGMTSAAAVVGVAAIFGAATLSRRLRRRQADSTASR